MGHILSDDDWEYIFEPLNNAGWDNETLLRTQGHLKSEFLSTLTDLLIDEVNKSDRYRDDERSGNAITWLCKRRYISKVRILEGQLDGARQNRGEKRANLAIILAVIAAIISILGILIQTITIAEPLL